jgi:hypothetical protein
VPPPIAEVILRRSVGSAAASIAGAGHRLEPGKQTTPPRNAGFKSIRTAVSVATIMQRAQSVYRQCDVQSLDVLTRGGRARAMPGAIGGDKSHPVALEKGITLSAHPCALVPAAYAVLFVSL